MIDCTTKACTKCKCVYPATPEYFVVNNKAKTGLGSWCRECSRAYARMRNVLPETKAKRAQWFQEWYHRGGGKEYIREWRSSPEQRLKKRLHEREYRKTPRAKAYSARNSREWQLANPEANAAKARRYLARKHNAEGSHTADDVQKQYASQKGRCWWCGKKVGKKYHVDHVIPLARGGSDWPENIVISCPSCNSSKRDLLPREFAGRLF